MTTMVFDTHVFYLSKTIEAQISSTILEYHHILCILFNDKLDYTQFEHIFNVIVFFKYLNNYFFLELFPIILEDTDF